MILQSQIWYASGFPIQMQQMHRHPSLANFTALMQLFQQGIYRIQFWVALSEASFKEREALFPYVGAVLALESW